MRPTLLACALLGLSSVTLAAPPKKPVAATPKPASVKPSPSMDIVGLKIGEEFTLKECPTEVRRYYPKPTYVFDNREHRPCYKTGYLDHDPDFVLSPTYASLRIEADKPAGLTDVTVKVIDGRIESISLGTPGLKFQDDIFELLSEKYGQPTETDRSKVQNHMGAEFEQLDATWKFTDLTVTFFGMGSKIDSGFILVDTPKAEAVAAKMREEQKASAPKL